MICGAIALPQAARAGGGGACVEAGMAAERNAQLPPGLLLAIGRVESGRANPASGETEAWPWTINVAGAGQSFDDRESALAAVRASQARGAASIDIGCFQINLLAHPKAFASLEEGFDPTANANYAARFLTELHASLGSWPEAVAAYHSSTPAIGAPYRDQVLARWGQGAATPGLAPHPAAGLQVVVWSPAAKGVRIWSPSPGAGANVIHFAGAPALPAVHRPLG